jgi:hypothetical protein
MYSKILLFKITQEAKCLHIWSLDYNHVGFHYTFTIGFHNGHKKI